MAARLVAIVVAVGMVVGALALRARWDDDGGSGGGGGGGDLVLVCAPEVAAACEGIAERAGGDVEVKVEQAGETADRLAQDTTSGFDGWLVPGVWPEIVRLLRAGQTPLLGPSPLPLVHTRVGFAMFGDRAAALNAHCGGAVSWRCVGESAGRPWAEVRGQPTWGPVRLSVPSPALTATGLAVIGGGTAGFFARTDVSTLDLEDPAFGIWLANVARNNPDTDLDRLLAAGPSLGAGAAVLQAVAAEPVGAATRGAPRLIYPAPVATVDVVFGRVPGGRGERLARLVEQHGRAALTEAGWTSGPGPGGLPSVGLLQALRSRWEDLR